MKASQVTFLSLWLCRWLIMFLLITVDFYDSLKVCFKLGICQQLATSLHRSFRPHLLAIALFKRVPKSPLHPLFPPGTARPEVVHMALCMVLTCVSVPTVASNGTMFKYSPKCAHRSHKVKVKQAGEMNWLSLFLTKGVSLSLCRSSVSVKISGSESWKKSLVQWMSEQMLTTPFGQWKKCKVVANTTHITGILGLNNSTAPSSSVLSKAPSTLGK